MRAWPWLLALPALALAGDIAWRVPRDLQPALHRVTIASPAVPAAQAGITVAVLADPHLDDSAAALEAFDAVVAQVLAARPALVLLLGDYVVGGLPVARREPVRRAIIDRLKPLTALPIAAVLGNYETYSDALRWQEALTAAGIPVLENRVLRLDLPRGPACLRGTGDAFTGRLRPVAVPADCEGALVLSLTHDPAGAFAPGMGGLVFAGHTHCGQVSPPLTGPLWAPTTAPRAAWCGLYEDAVRQVFTSSGLGTSLLPIRYGAPAQWDLVTLQPAPHGAAR